jgi:hypothetical protein
VNAQASISADSVRSVLDSVLAQPAYVWRERRDLLAFVRQAYRDLSAWLDRLGSEHPAAYFALLFALTCVLVVLLTHFGFLIWRSLTSRPEGPAPGPMYVARARDETWHLRAYYAALAEGRYTDAMAERFAALVFQLGRLAAVRLDHSKTPAEYAAEARLDEDGQTAMAGLVDDLYLRVFGGAPCTAADVRQFDAAAKTIGGRVAAA